jgi:protein-S-isoprenylcysteine O-methyltransferase Ste14
MQSVETLRRAIWRLQILAVVATALLIFAALNSVSIELPKEFDMAWTWTFNISGYGAAAAVLAAALFALYSWGHKNLPCPACKGRLEAVSESELVPTANDRHHYRCAKCKALWNSGISSEAW